MAFANERITGDDWERYNIPEIERRIVPGDYSISSTCAIDHDRGVYLLDVAEQRESWPDLNGIWPTGRAAVCSCGMGTSFG
ncbi:MAG: hypothetical protein LBF93_05835 [Zoogloeaceae bacterium]|jgi:hypothetical protein|nr:hypothetical protein [Zoogloeaceae bacterium]